MQTRAIEIGSREGIRLASASLHVDGHVGRVSTDEQPNGWLVRVEFSNITDTLAEVRIDTCSGAIVSSTIGGGF